jgi:hypothetical protein
MFSIVYLSTYSPQAMQFVVVANTEYGIRRKPPVKPIGWALSFQKLTGKLKQRCDMVDIGYRVLRG